MFHPGGVLTLARWYRITTPLKLVTSQGGTTVVGRMDQAVGESLARLLSSAGRAGYVHLSQDGGDRHQRRLDYAIGCDRRLHRSGPVLIRVDDRASGLALHVARMLTFSPRPLDLAELTGGLERNWRFRRHRIPTADTLSAWLDAQPWLEQRDGVHRIRGSLTAAQLKATGGAGTDVLAARVADRPATWAELVAALTARGVKLETARIAAMTNPVLVHTGADQYGLLGAGGKPGSPG